MSNPVKPHGDYALRDRSPGVVQDDEAAERGPGAAHLEAGEKKKASDEESLSAAITHEVIRREGQKELERPMSALAWSGLGAGLSMGFSFVAEAVLRSHLPDTSWRPLVVKMGYPVGFLMVSLASQELYTEQTLRPIVPLMAKRTREMLRRVSLLWLVVLVANLVGSLLFAWAIATTDIFRPEMREAFSAIGREALEGPFASALVRGVFAGWLIALMVWMIPAAEAAHVFVIFVMTWLVGVAGFSHIVAGSTEVMYLALTGQTSWGTYVAEYAVPTLIGNTLGGVTLATALNHAQVASGGGRKK